MTIEFENGTTWNLADDSDGSKSFSTELHFKDFDWSYRRSKYYTRWKFLNQTFIIEAWKN